MIHEIPSDTDFMQANVDSLAQEIVSLREHLAVEKAKQDIDLINNPKAWKMLADAIERGDEWKRRAGMAVDWIMVESRRGWAWKNNHPEAADWFEVKQ